MAHRRNSWPSIAVLAALLLVAAACSSDDDADATTSDAVAPSTEAPAPVPDTTTEPPTTEGSSVPTGTPEPAYERGLVDPGMGGLVAKATEDLAARLGISPEDIELLSAVLVTWPDSSLGCPEPGMVYAQLLQDGSVIELGANDRVYRYHTGGSTLEPFLCDQPLKNPPPAIVGGGADT
jgi:hypothetical protein